MECTTACIRRMLVLLFVAPAKKKNSCTHKRGVNIYKFLPILNANFMLFFSYPRDDEKKEIFALSFYCVINNDAKPAWLNRKSNEYVRDTVGISRAYDNRDFFCCLCTVSCTHFINFMLPISFLILFTTHANFSHHRSASWCMWRTLACMMHPKKKREKFWNLSITRFMHFYHPVGCWHAYNHRFLHSHS